MRLWRLSSERHAQDFTGGYGLNNSGRWNSAGRAVTYASTVPSLAALEKRVHVTDASLLPPLMMVEYTAPDDLPQRVVDFGELGADWTLREVDTQRMGDAWLDGSTEVLLFVPSVIVPLAAAPERNVLINHRHERAAAITIANLTPFTLDPRLFQP